MGLGHVEARQVKPRETVAWFATWMELKMKTGDRRGYGAELRDDHLLMRLHQETLELEAELLQDSGTVDDFDATDAQKIIRAAADVANLAMLIADKYRKKHLHSGHVAG